MSSLSFTNYLTKKFHISTLAKSTSNKLGVLWRLRPFFSPPPNCLSMKYGSHVWGWFNLALLKRVDSKTFCLINSFPLTDCLYSLSHRYNVAFLSLLYLYFYANYSQNLLTACLHTSRGLSVHGFCLFSFLFCPF